MTVGGIVGAYKQRDWYSFSLANTETVTLSLGYIAGYGNYTMSVGLFGANDTPIATGTAYPFRPARSLKISRRARIASLSRRTVTLPTR